MKYLKMLSLAAVAALAVMASVGGGTASADELCTEPPVGNMCPAGKLITEVDLSLTIGTSTKLTTTEGTTLNTCTEETLLWKISSQGTGVDPITGPVTAWFRGSGSTPCTFTIDTTKNGSLSVTNSSGTSGTVTGISNEVTINTGLFGSCVFSTGAGTKFGTITGGTNKLVVNTVLTRVSGLCPSTERWEATYTITNHSVVYIINN